MGAEATCNPADIGQEAGYALDKSQAPGKSSGNLEFELIKVDLIIIYVYMYINICISIYIHI